MLLRFGASNFRSFDNYQEVSLVATSLKDDAMTPFVVPELKHKVLPSVGVYGANASGKSNLLGILRFLRSGVLDSHTRPRPSGRIRRRYFKLLPGNEGIPSRFDCDFLAPNIPVANRKLSRVRMQYGFAATDSKVVEEWLYAFPLNHRQVWFHRKTHEPKEFYFGKELRGLNRTIEKLTRPDSLFLSVAAQNNHEQLTAVFDYFRTHISFLLGARTELRQNDVDAYFADDSLRDRIVRFLRQADIGVCSSRLSVQAAPDNEKGLLSELSTVFEKFPDAAVNFKALEEKKTLELGHASQEGEVYLSLQEESRGTLALLNMLGPIFSALDNGGTVVVDELDASMHPLLARAVLQLFATADTNPNQAQIIFSTHDSTLLSRDILRRDQVWFVEKNHKGASVVYPLSDIATRNTDNIGKGYLQGRFGAIPYIGDAPYCVNLPRKTRGQALSD